MKCVSDEVISKRKVLEVVAVSIVLIIVVITLFTNNFFDPQIDSAKITDFSVEWTPLPTVVGVTSISTFNITIENNGTVDIAGLILTFERTVNNNKTNPDSYM